MAASNPGKGMPLRWWVPAQLDALAQWLDVPWRQWQRDWGLASRGDGAGVRCVPAHEARGELVRQWQPLGTRGGAHAWIEAGLQDGSAAIHEALFGMPSPAGPGPATSVACEIAGACWREALQRLVQALALDERTEDAPPPASVILPWSGAAVAMLPVGGTVVRALLSADAVQAWLGTNSGGAVTAPAPGAVPLRPMETVTRALQGRKLSLRAELAGCDIELGALQGLRVGDVVRLSHALDTPLRMVGPGERHLGDGWLGRRSGNKAVELAGADSTAAPA